MHVFLLILTLVGQPEHVAAICDTYQKCSDKGAEISTLYQQQFHKMPGDLSYRVIPALIVPEQPTT